MARVKLNPEGIVFIDGRPFPNAKGNVKACGDITPNGIQLAISALTNFLVFQYTDFVDGDDQPFASRAAVINYLNANFSEASGVTPEQLDAKIQNKSQAEYDALTTDEKNNGTLYLIPKT